MDKHNSRWAEVDRYFEKHLIGEDAALKVGAGGK